MPTAPVVLLDQIGPHELDRRVAPETALNVVVTIAQQVALAADRRFGLVEVRPPHDRVIGFGQGDAPV